MAASGFANLTAEDVQDADGILYSALELWASRKGPVKIQPAAISVFYVDTIGLRGSRQSTRRRTNPSANKDTTTLHRNSRGVVWTRFSDSGSASQSGSWSWTTRCSGWSG
eukprot:1533897-Karenia_brevis.AAC.1